MTPFYFGVAERRLYGAYDPPADSDGPPRAAVICNPWGPEQIEAHRALRHLAAGLAGAGVHALRFDYFGTGDSSGDTQDGDIDGWRDDILTAVDELRDMSGADRVMLIGLRLGALLAAAAAAMRPDRIDALLLWDPLDDGDYLAELRDTATRYRRFAVRPVPRAAPDDGGFEVYGFPVTPALAARFADIDFGAVLAGVDVPARLVVSGSEADFARAVERIRPGSLVDSAHIPARPCWVDDTVSPGGFVPAAVLAGIVRQVA